MVPEVGCTPSGPWPSTGRHGRRRRCRHREKHEIDFRVCPGGLRDETEHRLRVHLRRAFLRPVEQGFSRFSATHPRRRVILTVRARDRRGDCPHPCPDPACQFSLTVDARFHHSVTRSRHVRARLECGPIFLTRARRARARVRATKLSPAIAAMTLALCTPAARALLPLCPSNAHVRTCART